MDLSEYLRDEGYLDDDELFEEDDEEEDEYYEDELGRLGD